MDFPHINVYPKLFTKNYHLKVLNSNYEILDINTGETKITIINNIFRAIPIIYIRQSTLTQASLQEQKDVCVRRASEDGHDKVIILRDKRSGWSEKSIKKSVSYKNMLMLISTGIVKTVYIYDVSRFMRKTKIAIQFLNSVFDKYNCSLISVTDGSTWDRDETNQLRFISELTKAEEFSLKLSKRIKDKINSLKSKGCVFGRPKYTETFYKDDRGILTKKINMEELKILGHILYYRHEKEMSFEEIAELFNRNNIKKRGKMWIGLTVKSALSGIENFNMNNEIKPEPLSFDYSNFENEMNLSLEDSSNDEITNWINCDSCGKWRSFPRDIYDEFKDCDTFRCYDIYGFKCSLPEEKLPDCFYEIP